MKDLKNRVALVTGAGSGIGQATAIALARAGCRVVLNDVCPDKLQRTVDLTSQFGPSLPVCADVTDPQHIQHMAAVCEESYGPVDILVNNAGRAIGGYIETTPAAAWEDLMRLNFWAYVYSTQTFLPAMLRRKSGHLVFVASISGLFTSPQSLPYGTSKFAVVALAEAVAARVRPQGIGVSLICPGITHTELPDHAGYFFASETESAAAENWIRLAVNHGVPPARVAQKIVAAIRKNRYLVLTHRSTRPLMIFRALFPSLYVRVSSWFHTYESARANRALLLNRD